MNVADRQEAGGRAPLLSVIDAAFAYPAHPPLFTGLSLAVGPGTVLCVLGPNGTGKSTLLRCLIGLERLSRGAVHLAGSDIRTLTRARMGRTIGFVPQSNVPVFAFPVSAMVEMGRAPHLGWNATPTSSDRAIVGATLRRLGIAHLAWRLFPQLSGGERQMVLIARALAQEPRVLILDEPTAHLDFANQADTLALVRRLADGGMGVIMTTHDPAHAFLLADQVLVMARGKAPRIGPPSSVLTEEVLSETYARPVRIVRAGDRVLCFAPVEPATAL